MKRALIPVLALASIVAIAGCSEPTLVAPPDTSRAGLFEELWHETDLTYSMFSLKNVNWDSVGGVFRPRALAATSDADFGRVLGEMLMTLRDRHVSLTPGPGAAPIAYHAPQDYLPVQFDESVVDRLYITRSLPSMEHLKLGWLTPTIGYIRIPTFSGTGWDSELDAALDTLQAAQRLVIDVRSNPGGTYELALALAGRFTTQSRTVGYVRLRNGPKHDDLTDFIPQTMQPQGARHFAGPIFVLTNRRVYSSAEDFVLSMAQLPNVVTVGDTTGGASGKPIVRVLANGWTYELSTWIEYTPDRRPIEDAGLAPSVVISDRALATAGPSSGSTATTTKRDAVLDQVLRASGATLP